ncbi:MAG: hypothetical protein JRJ16_02405 [Deltaproteobacteria bacterium]|nr:hypothetical protein [Deltaproteobacteria bacterium]
MTSSTVTARYRLTRPRSPLNPGAERIPWGSATPGASMNILRGEKRSGTARSVRSRSSTRVQQMHPLVSSTTSEESP